MTDLKSLGPKILERLEAKSRGKTLVYADVRLLKSLRNDLQMKNGALAGFYDLETSGFGVRVLLDGFWGFSSGHQWDSKSVDHIIDEALELALQAKRGSLPSKRVDWRSRPGIVDKWKGQCTIDPFSLPLTEKLGRLQHWHGLLSKVKGVTVTNGSMSFRREHKWFFSTEGSQIEQTITHSGMGYCALATSDEDAQTRSFPNSQGGQFSSKGFELLDDFDFDGEAPRVAEEAVALLKAPQCPAGVRDIIIDGAQLGLQIHESCGHPTELDRVLGWEANYAGKSFLTVDKLGKFTYGSPLVNIVADSTSPGGMGTFGYDDEGTPAQSWKLVDKGQLTGYLNSRETAPYIGLESSQGTLRSEGWNRMAMVRMVNVSLEPGTWELDALFKDSEGAIYFETNRSWSIDQLRYNFQFGTEAAWEIKNGKKGTLYKNATYQGITPEFWKKCDAVCGKNYWRLWGVPNCGKGEPGQLMGTGHGASPSRFRSIQVGVGYEK
jgi:TldD protein